MPSSTRSLAATIGSLTRWAGVHGADARREALAPARQGLQRKWEQKAIELGAKTPDEITESADRLRRAHCLRAAARSAEVRRRRARRA